MLGQLVNCPKCNSMLMIEVPQSHTGPNSSGRNQATGKTVTGQADAAQPRIEVQVPGTSPVDSTAMTKDGMNAALFSNLDLGEPSDAQASQAGAEPSDDEYRLAPSIVQTTDGSPSPPPVRPAPFTQHDWLNSAGPHLPSAEWTSDSTTKNSQYLLVGFMGFCGLALAAILFWGFLSWYARDAGSREVAKSTPIPSAQIAESGSETQPIGAPPDSQKNTDAAPENSLLPAAANDAASVAPEQQIEPTIAATEPIASSTQPSSTQPSSIETRQSETSQVPVPVPTKLEGFADMLQFELQPQFPDAIEVLAEAPVTAEDLGLTNEDAVVVIPAINLGVHEQTVIPALVIGPQSLSRFVNLWSNISGVPTVVDLDSLAAANIDSHQKLGLGMTKSTTIGSIASQFGQPLGLIVEPRENRYYTVLAAAETISSKLPSTIELKGLVPEDAGRSWMIETLNQLIPLAQADWASGQVTEGVGAKDSSQLKRPAGIDDATWFSAVRMIEGWRLATGQPSSLPNYDPKRFASAFDNPNNMPALDKTGTEISSYARPVAQVLPRVCEAAGLHVWIDWSSVGEVGLGPQTTDLVVTAARPLRRILADYASHFSLVVAIQDTNSLWLTSNRAYREQTQLYVIPSEGQSDQQWQQLLRPFTPAGIDGVGSVIIVPTPDGQFMLVRCCRPTVSF